MAESTLTQMQRMAVKAVMKLKHRQTIKRGSPLALSLAAALEEEEEVLGKPSPSPFLAISRSVYRENWLGSKKMKENCLWLGLGDGGMACLCVLAFLLYPSPKLILHLLFQEKSLGKSKHTCQLSSSSSAVHLRLIPLGITSWVSNFGKPLDSRIFRQLYEIFGLK